MTINNTSEAAKAVVRRNTEEVQGGGNFEVFDELFADDFLDHTPQPGRTPDKDGARQLYKILRTAFPDFHAEIHWQLADGDRVTTYKTYHGTHRGEFLGVAPTGRKIQFETVDVMRVRDGKITEHWGWPISSPLCSSSAPGRPSKTDHERARTDGLAVAPPIADEQSDNEPVPLGGEPEPAQVAPPIASEQDDNKPVPPNMAPSLAPSSTVEDRHAVTPGLLRRVIAKVLGR